MARPWNRLRAVSVFRDQSDLALTPGLWSTISEAIDGSRYFVLLASPESAASEWVNREVGHWCDTKGTDCLLIVLTGGELEWEGDGYSAGSTAVPAALHGRFREEPLYLDLRWARDAPELSLRLSRFRAAIAQIASPIRGVPPDELEGEDIRQHRRARRLARAAVTTVAVLAVVAVVAAVIAVGNARRADRRAREALGRQLGLAALDLPAGEVDDALLLALAAADLQGDEDPGRFQAGRALIGRYSRLVSLLHAPAQPDGDLSFRAVAIAPGGDTIAAAAWSPDGSTELLSWSGGAGGAAPVADAVAVGAGHVPGLAFAGATGAALLGAPGAQVTVVADGSATPLAGRVVALEPGTARAIVIDAGSSLVLVDVVSGARLATFEAAASDIDEGAFAVDLAGGRVAIATGSTIVLVDATTGAVLGTTDTQPGLVAVAAGRVDGAAVVGATDDGAIATWRRDGGALVARDAVAAPEEVGSLRRLVPSPDARRVLAIGAAGSALVDLATGSSTSELGAGSLAVADPSGRFVATGGTNLTVWDLATGQRAFAVPEPANALAWSGPCDADVPCRLATAGESLDVWEPTTGRRVRLSDQTNAQAVAISAEGKRVATAGWGSTVAVWALETPIDDTGRVELAAAGALTAVDPGTAMVARYDGSSAVDVTTAATRTRVETGPVSGLLLAGGERLVITAAEGVRLYATADGASVGLDPRCAGEMVAVSPGGEHLVTYDPATGTTVVCDTGDGAMRAGAVIADAADLVRVVAVDDAGDVALGRSDGVVVYHRVEDGAFRSSGVAVDVKFGGERVDVTALALRDGTIAAGIRPIGGRGAFARVLVWDAVEGGTPVQFDTDHRLVEAVGLFGAGAERVAVAGADDAGGPATVQVWEAATRRRLGRALGGLEGTVVTLGGDDSRVVGVDREGRALAWSLDTDPTAEICAIVGRSMEPEEWETIAAGALAAEPYAPVCGRMGG